MNHSEKLFFITHKVPELLLSLQSDATGNWGVLNAQQMVEHLSDSVRITNGKRAEKLLTAIENLEKVRAFMLSDKPFKENTKNAQMPEIPSPCIHLTMSDAIAELKVELNDFNAYFANNPTKTVMNPFFGALNFEQCTHLLHKHFVHHCHQFSLI